METAIIIGVIVIGLTGLYVVMDRRLKQIATSKKDDQGMTMLNQNIHGMQERLDKVGEGMNSRLDNAAKVIATVSKELGQVQEMSRNMQDLQNFLKSPKLRGNLGEQVLQDLLSQHFPTNMFSMQHKFKDGDMVDAILKTDNGMIGIDSKFPLENFDKMSNVESEEEQQQYAKLFARDVKKHIKDIAKKYILPEEGTVNFAVMYIPSEAIYYEIIRSDHGLNETAIEHKVMLVSPNSFFYFLRVIMMGMQGKRIEEQAEKILATMEGLVKDSAKFGDTLSVLGTHVSNTSGALERVNSEYAKLSGKIEQIKLLK